MPYSNDEEAKSANGGAYPPDMSVLVKARKGGADYIYSHKDPKSEQEFMPNEISNSVFYTPGSNKKEKLFKDQLKSIWKSKYKY